MTPTSITTAPLWLLAMASLAAAQHHESRTLPWQQLKQEGKLLAGQIQPAEGQVGPTLRISNLGQEPATVPLLVLKQMHPTVNLFALQGQLRYENVKGPAYLEMWTVLPDGSKYFTRTIADQGPLQKIEGSSPWRPFALPFNLRGESPSFVTIEVNAVMPGPGTIDLSPLRLVDLSPPRPVWWSAQTTGRLYGICGGVIGVTFGLLSHLAHSRRSRSLHTLLSWLALTVAAVFAVVGILAVISSQPFRVWSPPLLIAAMLFVIFPVNYYRQRRQYRDVELRKIQAMDT